MRKRFVFFIGLASIAILISTQAPNSKAVPLKTSVPPQPAAGGDWTTPVNISKTGMENRIPVIALDAQGKAYVTWVAWPGYVGAGGARDIMFNMNRTGQWQVSATRIAPIAYDAIDDTGFPTVAVTPSGSTVYVAYHDADWSVQLMQVFCREWANGAWGKVYNFSEAPAPSEYIALSVSPFDNTLFGIFMVDVDVPFELAMRYMDGQTGRWISADLTNILNGSSKYTYQTKIFLFDAKGTAHLVFTTHTQAWYSKNATPKNLSTWTPAVNLSGETGLSDTDPRIAVDNDGEAYAVWQQIVGGNEEIMFCRVINGQKQAVENISQTSTDSEAPSIAVNPTTKEIYIAWQEIVGGTNGEVYLKTYERQSGSTTMRWSDPVNFTNDPGRSGEPFLQCDSNGNIHMVYVDTVAGWDKPEVMYSMKQRGPAPPLNVALDTQLDDTEAKKINTLTWQANPANADFPIKNYKIYRKLGEGAFSLLDTVSSTTFQYANQNLDILTKHSYQISSLSEADQESPPSAIVDDDKQFELAPIHLAVTTVYNKTLFYRQKRITISFEKNPLDADANMAGYEIYRKKAGESDDMFVLFAALDATTLTYSYAIQPPDSVVQKYAYAAKAVFKNGRKSGYSKVVTEN